MQWHTQAGNITPDIEIEVDFTLPELSVDMLWRGNFMWVTPIRAYTI